MRNGAAGPAWSLRDSLAPPDLRACPGPAGSDGGAIITVAGTTVAGSKTFTVNCPANYVAISGGYNIQGSVTASYCSNASGNASGNTSWTITQTSGNSDSGTAYVYCMPVAS